MDKDTIISLTVPLLKDKLQSLKLSTSGNKPDLQKRLFEHFKINIRQDENEKEDDDEEEEGIEFVDAENENVHQDYHRKQKFDKTFTLRDISESLEYFDGINEPKIEKWIENFQENATAVGWNNTQKLLYAKQLIKGAARIFIRGQQNITSWQKLRDKLTEEFGTQLSAIETHKMLQSRRKKYNESYLEYLYTLIEIGSNINLDELSVVEYFIEGITDSKINKSILYGARTIAELKIKIQTFQKIKTSEQNYNRRQNLYCTKCPHLRNHTTEQCKKQNSVCYKCGKTGHKAHECRSNYRTEEQKQNLTYPKQNEFGNRQYTNDQSSNRNPNFNNKNSNFNNRNQNFNNSNNRNQNPNNRNQNSNNRNQNTNNNETPQYYTQFSKVASKLEIDVTINNYTFKAIFDTGSELSILTKSVLDGIGCTLFEEEKIRMHGVGQGRFETLGYIIKPVTIDKQKFNWKFYIVNDVDLLTGSLIGSDILEVVNVYIGTTGPTFTLKEAPEPLEDVLFREVLHSNERCDTNFTAGNVFRSLCMDRSIDEDRGLELGHLDKRIKYELLNKINNYEPEKTESTNVVMKITVTDDTPVFHRPRRLPIDEQKIVENTVQEWLQKGIIQSSNSQYAAPIVLAKKKDGTKRLCCDYRRINKKIIRDNFPMVLIDDVLVKLQKAKIFTTLDLKNGFFHVPVDEDSIKYTSFVTHLGQYEFLKAPFGMTNSPAAFGRYITAIFNDFILDGTVIIYMDDIVIPSENEQENLKTLTRVLNKASSHGLEINWKKCQFIEKEISFLGYRIKDSSIKPSTEKTSAVANFPQPTNIKSLQKFLGLTSYFRRFIQNYSTIAKPLSDLLKKDENFKFGQEQVLAFEQLKTSLTQCPVLQIYNPQAETEVHCDASMHGLGAALMQRNSEDGNWHPIEYMSRKTNDYEKKYHSYDLEVLAIVSALKKWRSFLLGIHFKIITDCIAFTQTLKKTEVPARITRWVIFLEDFNYEIEHRKGSKLNHVDALSRMYCLMLSCSLKHRIIQAQNEDVWTKNLKEIVSKQKHPEFFVKNNILFQDYDKELLVVPRAMEQEIIETAHRQGHFSAKKTSEIVQKNFFIQNLNEKTTQIVRNCVQCIITEAKAGKKEGFLNPIEKIDQPLHTYHIDHVGPLENTHKQYNHILTVVDGFSKFTWLYPTKSTGTNEVLNILEKNASTFGHPTRIVTDRGPAFTSTAFKEYCLKNNITHILTATGVPRSNGQVERMHKIVISLLTKLCAENKQNWYKYLDSIQQTINSTPPRSTKISPFKILTGLEMRTSGLNNIKEILNEELLAELEIDREKIREEAKENILKIQNENRKNFNKKRKEGNQYQIGDMVAIKRTQFGTGLKIKPNYLGPYKVTKIKRMGRYEVEKIGEVEGPHKTTTVIEYMKPWN